MVIRQFPFRRVLLLVLAGLTIFALLYLAASLPNAEFRRGADSPLPEIGEAGDSLPQVLLFPPLFWRIMSILFWGSLLVSILYSLSTPQLRRELARLTWSNGINTLILLLLIGVIIAVTTSDAVEEETIILDESPASLPVLETDLLADYLETLVETPEPPQTLTWLLSLLFTAGVLWLVLLLWRRRPRRTERPLSYQELSDRAYAAIAELRQGQQLDDVILRCYREMSDTVARQQRVQRQRGTTPREFMMTLQRVGLPETAVAQLTSLFEQVRYGGLTPGRREQLQAIDSLEAIVAACDRLRQAQEQPAP